MYVHIVVVIKRYIDIDKLLNAIYILLNSPENERNGASSLLTQDSEFRSFFGRIEDTIICFRDCLF